MDSNHPFIAPKASELPPWTPTWALYERPTVWKAPNLLASIPLWFSRNLNTVDTVEEPITMFPYHYGSHATWIWPGTMFIIKDVSIPLWFSRNLSDGNWQLKMVKKFPYHYGSHATSKKVSRIISALRVSIPLWFSRNRFHYKIIIYDYGN